MKTKVVLIGDSIRMGYQGYVQAALADVAEVWAPQENGGNSDHVREHLSDWIVAQHPDVVHLNCGLHDIKKALGSHEAAVPPDRYEANLRAILSCATREARIGVVWAATTPVNEQRHHATKGFDRWEADVRAYNAMARRVADECGVVFLNLYRVVEEAGRDRLLSADGVHFVPEGYELLGKTVADCLSRMLTPSC